MKSGHKLALSGSSDHTIRNPHLGKCHSGLL
jgi:hypothetical protein